MKDQIEALYRLQKQDRRMSSIERKLAAIPRRKREMDKDLANLEAMLQTEVDKLDDTRGFRLDQERQLEDEEEQMRASKQRLNQVKTPRELSAVQREIESTRRLAQKRREEIVNITTAIEEAEARIKSMEDALGDLRTNLMAERDRLEAIEVKLGKSAKKAEKSRKGLLDQVERDHLRRYERIRKRARGVGFVGVRERRCLACKMAVAHQTYVSLRAAEIIATCENCGRMLYWAGLFPEDESSEPKPKEAPKSA